MQREKSESAAPADKWVIDVYGNVERQGEAKMSFPEVDTLHTDRLIAQATYDSSLHLYGLGGEKATTERHQILDSAIDSITSILGREHQDTTSTYTEQFLDAKLRVTLARAMHDRFCDSPSIDLRVDAYREACAILETSIQALTVGIPTAIKVDGGIIQSRGDYRTELLDECTEKSKQKFSRPDEGYVGYYEMIARTKGYSEDNYRSLAQLATRERNEENAEQIQLRLDQEHEFEKNNHQALADARDRLATLSIQLAFIRNYAESVVGNEYVNMSKPYRIRVREYEQVTEAPSEQPYVSELRQTINEGSHFLNVYQQELTASQLQQAELTHEDTNDVTLLHVAA